MGFRFLVDLTNEDDDNADPSTAYGVWDTKRSDWVETGASLSLAQEIQELAEELGDDIYDV